MLSDLRGMDHVECDSPAVNWPPLNGSLIGQPELLLVQDIESPIRLIEVEIVLLLLYTEILP